MIDTESRVKAPIRLMLLVSGLDIGGAERQVVHLANNLDPREFDVTLVSLSRDNPLAADLNAERVRFLITPKRWRYDLGLIRRIVRLTGQLRTEVLHGFLFDADIAGRLAGRFGDVPAVIASERNSGYRIPWVRAVSQRLTRNWFDLMVANSGAGSQYAARTIGISPARVRVVHNGVDVDRFRPRRGAALREELGIPLSATVVGMVASFKPQKNHQMFVRVAQLVRRAIENVWFICAGDRLRSESASALSLRPGAGYHGDVDAHHRLIRELIDQSGLGDRLILAGNRSNVEDIYAACDATVLTSRHEGTPNVVLESLACGVPTVITDVADNAQIAPSGRVGFVVPVDDDARMARHVCDLLMNAELRGRMAAAAREWVVAQFSISAMAGAMAQVYREALARKRPRRVEPGSLSDGSTAQHRAAGVTA